jgi:hypothetical protein
MKVQPQPAVRELSRFVPPQLTQPTVAGPRFVAGRRMGRLRATGHLDGGLVVGGSGDAGACQQAGWHPDPIGASSVGRALGRVRHFYSRAGDVWPYSG